mgnify:CR=1 FL=1
MKIAQALLRILQNRSGATAIEYALIGGAICIAIVAGVSAVGESVTTALVQANDGFPPT